MRDLLDPRNQGVRRHVPFRQTFVRTLRALTQYLLFASWDHLLDFMPRPLSPHNRHPGHRSHEKRRQV